MRKRFGSLQLTIASRHLLNNFDERTFIFTKIFVIRKKVL